MTSGLGREFLACFLLLSGLTGLSSSNVDANGCLRIRLSLRNGDISSPLAHCNIVSLTFLDTGENIYLRETSNDIVRISNPTGGDENSARDHSKVCIYQSYERRSSMIISLLASPSTVSLHIVTPNKSYFIENATLSTALDYLNLHTTFNSSDMSTESLSCGVMQRTNLDFVKASAASTLHYLNNTIIDYYVELYLIGDNAFYRRHGNDSRNYLYTIANHVNSLYRPVGIHIVLVGLDIWQDGDLIKISTNSTETRQNVANYRTTMTANHDALILISGIAFNGSMSEWLGGICLFQYSVGVITETYSTNTVHAATIVAHNLGHMFNLQHDAIGCSCSSDSSNSYCIMNTNIMVDKYHLNWSDCSIKNLQSTLKVWRNSRCLNNVPKLNEINNSNQCGNGVVEAEEDCDPGQLLSGFGCCNPLTCKFQKGAECASGKCCNTETCLRLPRGTTCRSVANDCDLPEYCDGSKEHCPEDRYKIDSTKCSNSNGYCYSGICRSRDLQCQYVFGDKSLSADLECYSSHNQLSPSLNTGWCSYTFNGVSSPQPYIYTRCPSGNVICGRLHCDSVSMDIDNTNDPVKGASCFHAQMNMNLTGLRDPAMVPNGAPCSTEKWCVDSVCQAVPTLPTSCLCNSRGVCNDLSHCHCDMGYSGESCDVIGGCGGSVDSGPLKCDIPPGCCSPGVIAGIAIGVCLLVFGVFGLLIGILYVCEVLPGRGNKVMPPITPRHNHVGQDSPSYTNDREAYYANDGRPLPPTFHINEKGETIYENDNNADVYSMSSGSENKYYTLSV